MVSNGNIPFHVRIHVDTFLPRGVTNIIETCINYCEPGWAYMSSNEIRWINRIHKLATERPGECVIIKEPDDNGGHIYCKFPQKWARVQPPRQVVITDEQRANLRKNLELYRESKKNKSA